MAIFNDKHCRLWVFCEPISNREPCGPSSDNDVVIFFVDITSSDENLGCLGLSAVTQAEVPAKPDDCDDKGEQASHDGFRGVRYFQCDKNGG